MNIHQITRTYPGGGAGKIAADLHEGYKKSGHHPVFVVGEASRTDPRIVLGIRSRYPFLDEKLGPWISRASGHFLKMTGFRKFKEVRNFQRKIEKETQWLSRSFAHHLGREYYGYQGVHDWMNTLQEWPDVIQCHSLEGDFFDLTALPKMGAQSKVVLTLHNAWHLAGRCHHSLDCMRWKIGCGECPRIQEFPELLRDGTAWNWRFKKKIYQATEYYVSTPCQWLMDQVKESMLGASLRGSRVIPNGIDGEIFKVGNQRGAREKLGLPTQAKIILFVGNRTVHNRWKKADWMLDAVRLSHQKNPTEPLYFIMLGEAGEDRVEEGLTIRMAGHISDPSEVACYYQASDLYLHAALMDTFPNAVLEAMGCGLPIVATRVGGIPEQIVEGETGFLVLPGDIQEMSAKVSILLDNSEMRINFGKAGAQRVRDKFLLHRMVQDYLNWFEELKSQA
ncbi:MAG: glycosyltransferase [Verrucomicrobiota bacterium]